MMMGWEGWSGVKLHIRQHTIHIPAQLTAQIMMGWGGGLVCFLHTHKLDYEH